MSLTAAPQTPQTPHTPQTSQTPHTPQTSQTPHTPQTLPPHARAITPNGTWKHPKFDEIARRQYATTFDDTNVRAIVANAALLAASFFAHQLASTVALLDYLAAPVNALVHRTPYSQYLVLAVRLFLVANVLTALLPLVRRYYPDDLADIPLTPSQRSSMGLQPASATSAYPSPASAYLTPPRYTRSTPRTSFSNPTTTSYSPALASSPTTRSTYRPASPLHTTLFAETASSSGPATPTPATGRASVGLNNKWLYEKRRDSPRSGMFA